MLTLSAFCDLYPPTHTEHNNYVYVFIARTVSRTFWTLSGRVVVQYVANAVHGANPPSVRRVGNMLYHHSIHVKRRYIHGRAPSRPMDIPPGRYMLACAYLWV